MLEFRLRLYTIGQNIRWMVIALAAASTSWANRRIGTPASLGIPYTREEG